MADFVFIDDPGHAWLAVTLADLQAIDLTPMDFSAYSYRKGNALFYLEEDCDAPKFLRAWEIKNGRKPTFTETYQERTFIRALPSIK